MDANQPRPDNPFGMDERCTNCPALAERRDTVVHGYGDVGAEFVFIGEQPGEDGANGTGVPFTGGEAGRTVQRILGELGLSESAPDDEEPDLDNVFLTYLTRCNHPERPPTDAEVANCEPFLNAEVRMINPEIIVPVGERALRELALEYTTTAPEEFDIDEVHATTIRGRGFELVPMLEPEAQTDAETEAFVSHMADLMGTDYRQTKGRRGR